MGGPGEGAGAQHFRGFMSASLNEEPRVFRERQVLV